MSKSLLKTKFQRPVFIIFVPWGIYLVSPFVLIGEGAGLSKTLLVYIVIKTLLVFYVHLSIHFP